MPARVFGLLLLCLTIPLTVLADSGKVEATGAFADSAASDSLKKTLEPKGYRVKLADGSTLCDIWLRNGIATGKNDAQGAEAQHDPENARGQGLAKRVVNQPAQCVQNSRGVHGWISQYKNGSLEPQTT